MRFRLILILLSSFQFVLAQFAKEQNIYGWIDLQYEQSEPSEGNFGQPEFLDDISDISLTKVNLYYDFKPNQYTQALIEIGYKTNAENDPQMPKYVTGEAYIDIGGVPFKLSNFKNMTPEQVLAFTGDTITQEELDGLAFLAQSIEGQEIQSAQAERDYGGIMIERAWFDINLDAGLNFRFGRYVNPVGIWNVDHGSPVLITARQPFQMGIVEIYPLALEGAMVYGSQFIGDHQLEYKVHLSGGRTTLDNRPKGIEDLGKGWRLKYNMDLLDGISIGHSGYWGGMRQAYFRSTPDLHLSQDNLLALESIYADGQLDVLEAEAFGDIIESSVDQTDLENTEQLRNHSHELVTGIDFSISSHQFSLQSEYNYMYVTNQDPNSMYYQGVTEMSGFYTILSYEQVFNDELTMTPYFLYEAIDFGNNKFNPVVNYSSYPLDDWQNYFIGLNFGIFNNVRIKTEVGIAKIDLDPDISSAQIKDMNITVKQFLTQFSMAF